MNQFGTKDQITVPTIISNATQRFTPGNIAISAEALFKVSSSLYFRNRPLIFFFKIFEKNRRIKATRAVSANIIKYRLGKLGIIGSEYGKAKQKPNQTSHISPNTIVSSSDSIMHLIHKYSNFKIGATQC